MSILKTYSIVNEISVGFVNADRLEYEIKNSGFIDSYGGFYIEKDSINILGEAINNEEDLDFLVATHDGVSPYGEYKIMLDVNSYSTDFMSLNYKIGLKSGVSYTPIFYIHYDGELSGFIDKTEYYKDYVDDNNIGELILVVEENYTIDNSDTLLPYTARPALERTKTWKWMKDDGTLDEINIKDRTKYYNTRRKRKIESERRRDNVIEQLIDHVGLGGVLSGAFTDADDAYNNLTALQELHSAAFTGWRSSGRGSLVDVIENDLTTTWLDTIIPDNATTQSMIPWMIGLDFRQYIQDKLKGNIK